MHIHVRPRVLVERPQANPLWRVVRDLPASRHALREGDVLRLGCRSFRVRQLAAPGPPREEEGRCLAAPHCQAGACRICLQQGPSKEGPLVAPCGCRGSIRHMHLGCLRRWQRSAAMRGDAQPPTCELCKFRLPDTIDLGDGVPQHLLGPWQPPFLVLEAQDGEAPGARHVLSLAGRDAVVLGRGGGCDVRVADHSVSKRHATVRFVAGEFIFEDQQSKFGSLVNTRSIGEVLEPHAPFVVQAGPTLLTLTLQPSLDLVASDVPMAAPASAEARL